MPSRVLFGKGAPSFLGVLLLQENTRGGLGESSSGQHFDKTLGGMGRMETSKAGRVIIIKNTP